MGIDNPFLSKEHIWFTYDILLMGSILAGSLQSWPGTAVFWFIFYYIFYFKKEKKKRLFFFFKKKSFSL